MTSFTPAAPEYSLGNRKEIREVLTQFTASASPEYFLPYLQPGDRVLDFGCGTGSISLGLAEAIAPGALYGVDRVQSQIELAKALAYRGGHDNANFSVGDIVAMEFDDDFFDAAHCHNVLVHVPDTHAALAEVKRVLKPGGIIGCREIICRSSFTYPDFGILDQAWDMFEDVLVEEECHPHMGKALKSHILEAGFADVRVGASFNVYSAPEDLEFILGLARRWFTSSAISEAAIEYGAATQRLCNDIVEAYDEWSKQPGALVAVAYGEVIAQKPPR